MPFTKSSTLCSRNVSKQSPWLVPLDWGFVGCNRVEVRLSTGREPVTIRVRDGSTPCSCFRYPHLTLAG